MCNYPASASFVLPMALAASLYHLSGEKGGGGRGGQTTRQDANTHTHDVYLFFVSYKDGMEGLEVEV